MTVDDWFEFMGEAGVKNFQWTVARPPAARPHFSPIRAILEPGSERGMCPLCAMVSALDNQPLTYESWLWALRRAFGERLDKSAILSAELIAHASDYTLVWLHNADRYYSDLHKIEPIRRRLGAFLSIPENLL